MRRWVGRGVGREGGMGRRRGREEEREGEGGSSIRRGRCDDKGGEKVG